MSEALEVTLGGATYFLSPITLGNLAKFENHIRSERLQIALDAMPPGTDGRAEIVREILNGDLDIERAMASMTGASRLLYLSAVQAQPDLKYEGFAQSLKLEDMGVLDGLLSKLAFGKPVDMEDGDEEGSESPPAESAPSASD